MDTDAWAWLGDGAGQHLFQPPNVAGWDDSRWLDTATLRGRWYLANYALAKGGTKDPDADAGTEPLVREVSQHHWGVPLGEIRSALLGGRSEPAVVAVVELVSHGTLPQRGFVKQEDIPLLAFLNTTTGHLFVEHHPALQAL